MELHSNPLENIPQKVFNNPKEAAFDEQLFTTMQS